jgi:hypothetical protein
MFLFGIIHGQIIARTNNATMVNITDINAGFKVYLADKPVAGIKNTSHTRNFSTISS